MKNLGAGLTRQQEISRINIDGYDFWHMNWKLMNLIHPRILLLSWIDGLECTPYSTVTLESGTESNLPRPITLPDPPLGLSVCQFIPQRAAGSVSKPIKSHSGGLHMPISELKVLL